MYSGFVLSDEQQTFIDTALAGKNILVDACIGSGKTTAIQHLCAALPQRKNILYLTYNKLLKLDARAKIHSRNTTVNNYHGFAYMVLKNCGISAGVPDLIQKFNEVKPPVRRYDVLVIDEYQDIEQEFAEMLEIIRAANPRMQIVAVGDMEQKIYDRTTLDVRTFIDSFLGDHERLTFTNCYRLPMAHAAMLGRVWNKHIVGVNEHCIVQRMNLEEVERLLAQESPGDILCLGARTGDMTGLLNELEEQYPDKFNKRTVYASISDDDGNRAVVPDNRCAIFTTYDSSKGMERKVCVVFDFTESYWRVRIDKPQQSYEILRNIFCVAASRGKERIIFVDSGEEMLSEETLSTKPKEVHPFDDMDISGMFDFKYEESVEACYRLLQITHEAVGGHSAIDIKTRDELIDLSPCIGIYQEAVYFKRYNIDKGLELYFTLHPQEKNLYRMDGYDTLDKKILLLTSLETRQRRYREQVAAPFVRPRERRALIGRLKERLKARENVQVEADIQFGDGHGKLCFTALGLADVVKGDTVYELKFVSELNHRHFLQCACYMVALNLPHGILWNTRTNAVFHIAVPDRTAFLDAVASAVTKGAVQRYYRPGDIG